MTITGINTNDTQNLHNVLVIRSVKLSCERWVLGYSIMVTCAYHVQCPVFMCLPGSIPSTRKAKQGSGNRDCNSCTLSTLSLGQSLSLGHCQCLLRVIDGALQKEAPEGPSACSCCLSTAESLSTWLIPCWADQRKANFQMGNRQCQKLNVQRHWHMRHNHQIFKKKLWHIFKLNLFLYCVFVQYHS